MVRSSPMVGRRATHRGKTSGTPGDEQNKNHDSKMLQSSRYFFESVFPLGGREGRGFSQDFVDAIAEINARNKARESIRFRLPPGPTPKTG